MMLLSSDFPSLHMRLTDNTNVLRSSSHTDLMGVKIQVICFYRLTKKKNVDAHQPLLEVNLVSPACEILLFIQLCVDRCYLLARCHSNLQLGFKNTTRFSQDLAPIKLVYTNLEGQSGNSKAILPRGLYISEISFCICLK